MRREEGYDINMFTKDALDLKPASGGSSFLVGNGKAAYAKGHPLNRGPTQWGQKWTTGLSSCDEFS
jgi:hypothetical protein